MFLLLACIVLKCDRYRLPAQIGVVACCKWWAKFMGVEISLPRYY